MENKIFHLQSLSALHVGTGQGVGVVDLPISRAKATNLPIVAGSALKGVLRDTLSLAEKDLKTLFGPKDTDNASHAGAVAFGDANLLLLPIRSFAGTVAYATCPFILRQYQRDLGLNHLTIPTVDNKAGVIQGSKLLINNTQKIALEDLDIDATHDQAVHDWADAITKHLYPDNANNAEDWRALVRERFVVLPDNVFSFLADTATEIRTRIKIDRETRIVIDGALWTEENLPAETVLWGVLAVSMSRKKDDKRDAKELAQLLPTEEICLQIGGKHTVGRGLCRLLLTDKEA